MHFSGEHASVKAWFDRGAVMHSCQSAAQKVLQGKGLQGMKSFMQRQPALQSSPCRDTQPCNGNPAEVSDHWNHDQALSILSEEESERLKWLTTLMHWPQETCTLCEVYNKNVFFIFLELWMLQHKQRLATHMSRHTYPFPHIMKALIVLQCFNSPLLNQPGLSCKADATSVWRLTWLYVSM